MRDLAVGFAALLPLIGCAGGSGSPTPSASSPPPVESSGNATCSFTPVGGTPPLRLERVASSLDRPVALVTPDDRSRLFIAEQRGRIRVLAGDTIAPEPFLDISDRVDTSLDVYGLLGLAFHPRFSENGRFFVNYVGHPGVSHVSEFRVAPGASIADPATERPLLVMPQPFGDHNGGQLAFGSDGMLYVATGDGGSGGDPQGHGQNLGSLLAKILRIDVDGGDPYRIPPGNPFVGRPDARGEVWAYGLRNPWRFSFDRANGDLYIADVGEGRVEEVDVGLAARRGGENYGWAITEGSQCLDRGNDCPRDGITFPVVEYGHVEGCAVTGGFVYRGCRMPGYAGTYFYGDFCAGFVRSFRLVNGQATDERDWTPTFGKREQLTSFGVDAEGEIYLLELGGGVFRIVPE